MIKQLSTKIAYQNPWMKVREDQVEFSNGHTGIYGVVEKDHFALIIPFDGTHFHLVKQFRYATQEISIEFPQGKHEGEATIAPRDLANEELQEEIGLIAAKVEKIGFLYEACGYSTQGFHIFLATELTQGETKPDITETDLEHLTMTVSEFQDAVKNGTITDAPTVSAFGVMKVMGLV